MDSFEELEAAVRMAERHWSEGNLEQAYQAYQRILRSRVLTKHGPVDHFSFAAADLLVMERTADLAVFFDQVEAANSLFATIISLTAGAGNFFASDYARLKRIHLLIQHSRFREAYEMLSDMEGRVGKINHIRFVGESLAAWENTCQWPGASQPDRTVLFAQFYLVVGLILIFLGQYKDGTAAFRRGLFHCDPNAASLARQYETPIKLGLARALLEFGDLSEAKGILENLENSINKNRSPGHFVQYMELVGRLSFLRGELGKARANFEKVCDFCQAHNFEAARLRAILNLVHVLIILNNTSYAMELLSTIENHPVVKDSPTLSVRTRFLSNMARLRASSMADGIPLASSVTQLWESPSIGGLSMKEMEIQNPLNLPQADSYLSLFEERCLAFYWSLGRGHLEFASRYLENIHSIFSLSDSYLIHTRLQILVGTLAYYHGKYAEAQEIFQKSIDRLQELGLKPEHWQLLRFLAWCGSRLGLPPATQHTLNQKTDQLLAEMTDSLKPQDQAIFLLNKWTEEEIWLAGEINRLADLKLKYLESSWWLRPFRWWKMASSLNDLINRVEQYKERRYRQTVSGKSGESTSTGQVGLLQRLIRRPPHDLTLSFLVLPDRTFIARCGWLVFDFGVSPISRIQLRDLVRSWHQYYARSFSGNRQLYSIGKITAKDQAANQFAKHISDELANNLQINPSLDTLPARIRRLCIIPDDALHGFPFAALPYRNGFLIEKFALRVSFEQNHPQAKAQAGYRALLVGVSHGGSGFNHLPGVTQELNLVQEQMSKMDFQIQRLEDQSVTKQTVLENLAASSYFHIACHGIFEQNTPDRSGLVLNPASTPVEILSLRELSRLTLQHVNHATLSSCWSADYFVVPGRWVISLPETLLRSGIHSILGALWVVHDEVAVAFMDRFYFYLHQYDRDEALRQVQLECLRGLLPRCESYNIISPVYWGGFNLYGDYSKIK